MYVKTKIKTRFHAAADELLGHCQKEHPRHGSTYGFYDTDGQSYQEFQMGEKKIANE